MRSFARFVAPGAQRQHLAHQAQAFGLAHVAPADDFVDGAVAADADAIAIQRADAGAGRAGG
jgi:hypothetical protein